MSRGCAAVVTVLSFGLVHACMPVSDEMSERLGKTTAPILWAAHASLPAISPRFPQEHGRSVALEGTTAVVSDDVEGSLAAEGAVYVYERTGGQWTPQVKLERPAEANGDHFGYAVDLSGDTIVGGAYGVAGIGNHVGVVSVFQRSGGVWSHLQDLAAPDGDPGDQLGYSVAISGDVIVAGARSDDELAGNAGAAYAFVRSGNTWAFEAKLLAPDGGLGDEAGTAVALDGTTAAIGAPKHDIGGTNNAGAVYVYERSGGVWGAPQKIEPPTSSAGDTFGRAVALDGDTLIVGEPLYGASLGRALVFVRSGGQWSLQAQLEPPVGNQDARAGDAVAIDGDRALIGARNYFNGVVFVYERSGTTWTLTDTLEEPFTSGGLTSAFGWSVALDGLHLVVGAIDGDEAVVDGGSAWAFALVGQPCVDASTCASGLCVHGFCCNAPCDEGCGRCDVAGVEGACTPLGDGEPGEGDCEGFLCGATADCPTPCDMPTDCLSTHYCERGACAPKLPDGEPCSSFEACQSGICVDGVCCDQACQAPCEACAEPGAVGSCTVILGEPRAGHPPCPDDSCADGIASASFSCRGELECSADETGCEPYTCGDESCLETCLSDGQCASGYDCDVAAGICLSTTPVCDGVDQLTSSEGVESCRPYRCTTLGACLTSCISTADCSPGLVCSSDGACLAPPEPRSPASCAARPPSPRAFPLAIALWWAGLAAVALGARRRATRPAR